MKTLKEFIIETNTRDGEFPQIKDFKCEERGSRTIRWYCGNDMCKEYFSVDENDMKWAIRNYSSEKHAFFNPHWNDMDNFKVSIGKLKYNDHTFKFYGSVNIDYGDGMYGPPALNIVGRFVTEKEAKQKMYDILCKIRDDKNIITKLSTAVHDKFNRKEDDLISLTYEEFMNL